MAKLSLVQPSLVGQWERHNSPPRLPSHYNSIRQARKNLGWNGSAPYSYTARLRMARRSACWWGRASSVILWDLGLATQKVGVQGIPLAAGQWASPSVRG
jgi:hypothetical protein